MSAINETTFDEIEAALRGEFSARAESLAATTPPYAAVRRAVQRDRTRRLTGAASGLALVAALISTVTLTGSSGSTTQSAASAPSPLLTIPTRGNLAGDSAFLAAVKWRLDSTATHVARPPGASNGSVSNNTAGTAGSADSAATASSSSYSVLYANDDGQHRVAIAGAFDAQATMFAVLVGRHGDAASALRMDGSSGSQDPEYFTYLGPSNTGADPTPFVVLGPTNMTDIEYAEGATLTASGNTVSYLRHPITNVRTVNGVASGEIPPTSTVNQARKIEIYTVFRAEIGGHQVDVNPLARSVPVAPGSLPTGPDTAAIRNAVAAAGRAAGLSMHSDSPGGDAVPDNVAQVLRDLADFSGAPIGSISYQIDWIGRETAQWDAALLDIRAPELPPMQIFVRGLTAGAPDSDSPGSVNTLVRPAVVLTPGHVPHTGASFGGTPEPKVFGYQVMTTW